MKYLRALSLILFFGHSAGAQNGALKNVKNYYKNQKPNHCLQLYQHDSLGVNQIIFIRHGEPDLHKKGWRRRNEAIQYALDYDSVGVIVFDNKMHCLEGINTDKVYHSSLPRAKHTAELLFGERLTLIEDARFREFERKVVKFLNLKMPLKLWMGISRVLWFIKSSDKDIESFKRAKKRARENSIFLAERAKKDGQVILVAHGLHNRYVMKYLRQNGWEKVKEGGSKYLAVNVLAKPDDSRRMQTDSISN